LPPGPLCSDEDHSSDDEAAEIGVIRVGRYAQAAVPEHTTPAALAALVRTEQEAWGQVVRSENIRLD
jgi:hypothetical protein